MGTYELVNVTMSAEFVEQWLPDPAALTARRLDRDGRWSAPLAAFVAQLTPDFATRQCPLPDEVVAQQLGVLLMLAAGALGPRRARPTAAESALRGRVVDQLHERSAEAGLTAADVAESLGVVQRAVHNALAANGETFAALLIRLRIRHAEQLRSSTGGRRIGLDELARSTGFREGARLAEAMRNRVGVP